MAANGAWTFTPVLYYNGAVPVITYTATNGTDLKTATLSLTINPINHAPVAVGDLISTPQETPVTINALANDTDVDHDNLIISQINSQAIVTNQTIAVTNATVQLLSNGMLLFTPGVGVVGTSTFNYTASDGRGGTAQATVTVNVIPAGSTSGIPRVLYLDTLSAPGAGGENNQGGYLSIFGVNFGDPSGLGTVTKVYIGGVEVNNYRCLQAAKNSGKFTIQHLAVQPGAGVYAAYKALSTPAPMSVVVVINGTASSNATVTFTPTNGRVGFVSLTGTDATAVWGDITKPWRHLQTIDANSHSNGGAMNAALPGDQIVVRGGVWTDTTGIDGCWARFTGGGFTVQGTQAQPIHFTAYPGPINGNVFESVWYNGAASSSSANKGGIHGPNSAYCTLTGNWITVSNFRMDVPPNAPNDAAPINAQYAFFGWRVVNCELGPWASTVDARGGGFSGHPQLTALLGNHIHDFGCTGNLLNHGIYADSGATDWEVAYNYVHNIPGGNLFQVFDQLGLAGSGTSQANEPPNWLGYVRFFVHHNWFEEGGKYGLNLNGGQIQLYIWNNVVVGATYAGLRMDLAYPTSNWDIIVAYNTFYDNDRVVSGSGNGQVLNDNWNAPVGGTLAIQANVFAAGPRTISASNTIDYTASPYWKLAQNLFRSYQGVQTWANFGTDAQAVFYDSLTQPIFNNEATRDFTLVPTSPAVDAITTTLALSVTDDFTLVQTRPQGTKPDFGAFESPNPKPYLTGTPVFTGTQQVNGTSGIGTGTWGNSPTSYAYQWFTCTTANGTPTNIASATTASFTWQLAQAGLYGGCLITGTNASGSTTIPIYTGAVTAADARAPQLTTACSITGTGGIGNLLSRTAGVWTPGTNGDAVTVTWVWQRNGSTITGTSGAATYTQVSADDSAIITILETATNSFGVASQVSSNSITVPHVPSAPTIVGTPSNFSAIASSASTTFSKTVQAGDVIAMYIACGNNNVYNLAVTDNSTSTSPAWTGLGWSGGNNTAGGWLYRLFNVAGTVTVTVPTTGGAYFAGIALLARGVSTTTLLETGDAPIIDKASPLALVPGTTANANDLILAGWGGDDSNYGKTFTFSDTFVAGFDDLTISAKQVQIQKRITSTAGAQSNITFTWVVGTSGSTVGEGALLKLRGF
jgi:hypothetical protein